jgi:hypothetical protein
MKRICILILVLACLLLTACGSSPSTTPSTVTPDNNATIVAGVMQTLTAQAVTPTQVINIQTAIAQTLTAMPTSTNSQPTQPPASDTPVVEQTPENTPTITSAPAPISSPIHPQIKFTFVPPIGGSDDLQGTVGGVNPDKYVVAIYIRVAGGWWTKPTFADPTIPIENGSWDCQCWTGGNDTSATAIMAYLIPIGYNPPAMSGGPNLPSALAKNAVAMDEAVRKKD